LIVAALLVVYAVHGVWNDDLYVPGRHSDGVHLHGVWAWAGLLITCALMVLSVPTDDARFTPWRWISGIVIFVAGLGLGLFAR